MLKRLASVFAARRSPVLEMAPSVPTIVAPAQEFYAIGDVHGCLEQMQALIAKIRAQNAEAPLVFLGDYIDRGPHSAGVLAALFEIHKATPDTTICLMGNHERMLLDFIDDPAGKGARWLANGGTATLDSYQITGIKPRPDAATAMDAADALEAAMPDGMLAWLRTLPLRWSSGNVHCVHAAMDPACAPDAQNNRTLLWGHPGFLKIPRADGACVVFGHVIVPHPDARDGRIALDTGAYRTGVLSAVHISASGFSFLQS